MSGFQILTFATQQALDTAANVLSGATMTFSLTGTSTPTNAYADKDLTIALANPLSADAAGDFVSVFLDPAIVYRIVLKTQAGVVLKTWDPANENILAAIDAAFIGQTLYPRTSAELTAAVTPVNYHYPPLHVDRYGVNTTPGTTPMTSALQAAINVAKVSGGTIRFGATLSYLITGALDCTMPVGATNKSFSFEGESQVTAITVPSSIYAPTLILKHTGHGFDCTGTLGVFFRNLTITTDSSTYPETCFLLARNTDARSMQCRFDNVMVFGSFSKAINYLYGAEETVWKGCQLFNRATDANAKVNIVTQNNIRSVTSTFTTIATLGQSSLGYNWIGCSQLMFSNHATADVWEIDSANFGNVVGGWAACANGTGGGRSIVYVNTTNGMASGWMFSGLLGEASVPSPPANGVLFGTEGSGSGSAWTFVSCAFPHTSRIIGGGHASASLVNLVMINLSAQGVGTGGVNFAGTLNSPIDAGVDGTITAGTIIAPNSRRLSLHIETPSDASVTLRDDSAGANSKGYRFRSTGGQFVLSLLDDTNAVGTNGLVVSRSGTTATLWDLSTSTAVNLPRVGFNGTANIAKPTVTGSRGGNAALASLLTALANYGLITDSSS
jgi:hypothetical protein